MWTDVVAYSDAPELLHVFSRSNLISLKWIIYDLALTKLQ